MNTSIYIAPIRQSSKRR